MEELRVKKIEPPEQFVAGLLIEKQLDSWSDYKQQLKPRLKIPVSMDISVFGFYGYISGYFYMSIDISEIFKNTLEFIEILCKSVKMTLIIKYTH